METLYDLLGVRQDADAETIRKAFRKAVKDHHPDLHANDPKAEQRFKQIIAANDVLRDEEQREAYDRQLELERQQFWQEWRRTFVKCAIAAAIVSSCLVAASALLSPLQTTAGVGTKTNDETARAANPATVASAPVIIKGAVDETLDKEVSIDWPAGQSTPAAPTGGDDDRLASTDSADAGSELNDAKFYSQRGIASFRNGELDHAISDFNRAIRVAPGNPALFHVRGLLWRQLGALDNALVDLDQAIRFTFTDPVIYSDRGLVWYEKGRYDRAIADFNQALKIDPGLVRAYLDRGIVLFRKGAIDRAIADLEQALRLNRENADAFCAPHSEPRLDQTVEQIIGSKPGGIPAPARGDITWPANADQSPGSSSPVRTFQNM